MCGFSAISDEIILTVIKTIGYPSGGNKIQISDELNDLSVKKKIRKPLGENMGKIFIILK